tara:strand:+ start:10111 stop:12180 length:2070 start_codon:yes stop_codon:yes gene_type:complete
VTVLVGLPVALLVIMSATGYGDLLNRLLGAGLQDGAAGLALRTAIGLVFLGWMMFWLLLAGGTSVFWFSALVAPGVVYTVMQWRILVSGTGMDFRNAWPLFVVAAGLFAVDMLAATMPVFDADSNAYHFTLPLQFLARGELFLIPRAVDGAAPLLFQALYALPLQLGGEFAMLATTKLVVWVVALLIYGVARPFCGCWMAGALALIFLTMPAVIYSLSAGQVEARIALLTLAAAVLVWSMRENPTIGRAVLVGLLCGGVAAAKFTGLLYAAAAGLVLIAVMRRPAWIIAAGLAGLVAGGQWYGWLWFETGSPLFPMFAGPPYWDASHAAEFSQRILRSEAVLPGDFIGLMTYPYHVFMATDPGFEADRTGLGPALFALLPISLVVAIRRIGRGDIFSAANWSEAGRLVLAFSGIVLLFYVLWWFFGASQRVRHLVPVIPLVLVVLGIAAHRACRSRVAFALLGAVLILSAGIQAGGWAFFHRATAGYVVSGADRVAALRQDLFDYDAIGWMAENFTERDLLVLMERRNNFYLGQPFYRISSDMERLVSHGEMDRDPRRFLSDLNALGATHILFHLLDNPAFSIREDGKGPVMTLHEDVDDLGIEGNGIGRFHQLVMKLLRDGCGEIVHLSRTQRKLSRTLAQQTPADEMAIIVRLVEPGCAYPESFGDAPVQRGHTDWTGQPRLTPPGW